MTTATLTRERSIDDVALSAVNATDPALATKVLEYWRRGGASFHVDILVREVPQNPAALDVLAAFLEENMPAGTGRMPAWMEDAYEEEFRGDEPEVLAGPKRWCAEADCRIRDL
jgi:hypothetical protein